MPSDAALLCFRVKAIDRCGVAPSRIWSSQSQPMRPFTGSDRAFAIGAVSRRISTRGCRGCVSTQRRRCCRASLPAWRCTRKAPQAYGRLGELLQSAGIDQRDRDADPGLCVMKELWECLVEEIVRVTKSEPMPMSPQWARTLVIMMWMWQGDLRPLADAIVHRRDSIFNPHLVCWRI